MEAAFAQQSGLAFNDHFIYVVDCESNVVQQIDLLKLNPRRPRLTIDNPLLLSTVAGLPSIK